MKNMETYLFRFEKEMNNIKKELKFFGEKIENMDQAIGLIYLQSGNPQRPPTYEPFLWKGKRGNCYNYVANDLFFDFRLYQTAPQPGFTRGKAYDETYHWRKVVIAINVDGRGRVQLISDYETNDMVVPKSRKDGYFIVYLVTIHESPAKGFHFVREDKDAHGKKREGWSHRCYGWDEPEQIDDFPNEGENMVDYRLEIRDYTGTTMTYQPVCILFVMGNGFHLAKGMTLSSSEFNENPEKLSYNERNTY